MRKKVTRAALIVGAAFLLLLFFGGLGWSAVQLPIQLNPALVEDYWVAADNGAHNGFTDLIQWDNEFYLAYRSAANHASQPSHIVVSRSPDGRSWKTEASLSVNGEDLRDPKMAVITGRLFLYALKNKSLLAEPYTTVVSSSTNGRDWSPWESVEPAGWLFWRPRSLDGKSWYAPAYSARHDQTKLFRTQDGKTWEEVSEIYSGEAQSEVDVAFTSRGNLVGAVRLDGHAETLLAFAEMPYQKWSRVRITAIRLDGPLLFPYQDFVFAIGRSEPPGGVLPGARGGLLNKKRTSLFQVTHNSLIPLTDFPSSGDTSYAGLAVNGSQALVSYYSNDPRSDLPWLAGQFANTRIYLARLNLLNLIQAVATHP